VAFPGAERVRWVGRSIALARRRRAGEPARSVGPDHGPDAGTPPDPRLLRLVPQHGVTEIVGTSTESIAEAIQLGDPLKPVRSLKPHMSTAAWALAT